MKTITITNQKGGSGKTTTAVALAAGLAHRGYRVLAVDLDAQGNLSDTARAKVGGPSAFGVLAGEAAAAAAIQHCEKFDLIPASRLLAGAEASITETGKEHRLREALEPVQSGYDFCVIDTPPALGLLTVNALTVSDYVVIPAQGDLYSLMGITDLARTIASVRKYTNPGIRVAGILLTRFTSRTNVSRAAADMAAETAAVLNTAVFTSTIRDAAAVKEAQMIQRDIFTHAPESNVAEDYNAFITELLKIIEEN